MFPLLRNPHRHLNDVTDHLSETAWDILQGLVILALIGGLSAAGYFIGVPAWRHWQNRQALAEAEGFAQARDYRSVMLALRRATELEPGDRATWQAASRVLTEIGSDETLIARQQLTQIVPGDMASRLALADEALRLGRFDAAESAIRGLDAAARQDIAFHKFAAALAAAMGRPAEAERELRFILAAEPNDLEARFNYAALRLWSADPGASRDGAAELEKLLGERPVCVRAAIELLASESRLGDSAHITHMFVRLLARFAPAAAYDFTDPAPRVWTALVDGIKAVAASSPADAALTARWLAGGDRWPEALTFIETLPAAVRDSPPVADIAAEISAEHDDLPRLERLLSDGAWGDWPKNAQALALASRIQVLRFGKEHGRQTWDDAIAAAGESATGLRSLARLAAEWHSYEGEELVLHRIVERDPKIFWAYAALRTLYLQHGDFPQLWMLYAAWSKQMPDDPSIAATWMLLGSLLDHADWPMVVRATELHTRFPDSLSLQVAYAAVLWRQHRAEEAAAILTALPTAAQDRPDISFWIALVQADLGHSDAASAAIIRARSSANSKEEKGLLVQAESKVGMVSDQIR